MHNSAIYIVFDSLDDAQVTYMYWDKKKTAQE